MGLGSLASRGRPFPPLSPPAVPLAEARKPLPSSWARLEEEELAAALVTWVAVHNMEITG